MPQRAVQGHICVRVAPTATLGAPRAAIALKDHSSIGADEVPSVGVVPSPLMPAAVYVGDGKIAVEQVPRPEPGPGEVLVEIAECGICGSDLHMVLERYAKPGAILGHEWSGIVAAAPSGSGWSPGDRVVGNPAPGCGVCRPCRRGRPSVCLNRAPADFVGYRGAFCQYKTVAADGLIRIPDSLPTRVAALAEPMAITLHAIRLADVEPGRSRARHGGRPGRPPARRRPAGSGGLRHHRERAFRGPAPAGPRRRGHPGPDARRARAATRWPFPSRSRIRWYSNARATPARPKQDSVSSTTRARS